MPKMYKFLNKQGRSIKSANGDTKWKIGEWQTCDPDKLELCQYGFHASKKVYQAFSYVQGDVLAEVEVKGKHKNDTDKQVWSEMRIVRAWKWQKKDSVTLAIYSAELSLKEFEKLYPDDKRPREAIEAARKVLEHDTAKNRSAARSAESAAWSAAWSAAESAARSAAWSAAWSAESATRSAESAARSAESAARSARSAAWSAAWSAESAAWSAAWSAAESAAWSAAWSAAESAAWSAESAARSAASALIRKIDRWMVNHIKELEEL